MLVLRRGGLGDTLLTLPLLAALRAQAPDCALAFAGVREYAEVLCAFGAVDEALSSEALELWSPARSQLRLQRFAWVIGDAPGCCHEELVPQRVLPGVPFGVQLAQQVGRSPCMPEAGWLRSVPGARTGPLVFAPGSGGRAKCWPAERWLELRAQLVDEITVVVGPTEQERDDPRLWPWPQPVTFWAGLTALELAHRLGPARGLVGNDSGVTHLAAALQVPTLALFGPTDPAVWAPIGPHVQVLQRMPLANLSASEVANRLHC